MFSNGETGNEDRMENNNENNDKRMRGSKIIYK